MHSGEPKKKAPVKKGKQARVWGDGTAGRGEHGAWHAMLHLSRQFQASIRLLAALQ